ncbi:MAG: T9SS type A sorting domain-containing protein [Candidatus Eisenbacteria bacterium]|uniref:T9SS type A sorting domain-containing protein n=1 Tax=Eiseniibacteriota bacterium TaxID=2212470 RepID=A0A948RSK8_UNCEI|nr:T9SS type A sorting domain-containing protein [Candidatus Eisenbacteria bacterium]MBU1950713.1 T9SS type A sorting domain-containing protein [Candidatus Eisenbacteria bacterium]MBU2690230.1 T9SS type A sorting domain-containing protein [Candidatus Eisenbacteria bacterium]
MPFRRLHSLILATSLLLAAAQSNPALICSSGFADMGAGLPGVYQSSVAWGDYDNDGDLDILLTGYTGAECIARVYRNDTGTFADIDAGLTGVYASSVAWGDYDNDGDLDILLTGDTGAVRIARVYRNDAGTFADIDAGLTGVYSSSVAWGDYDNDGDLDILLAGDMGSEFIACVYRNDAGTFADVCAGLTGVNASSAAWGDYDNDGDLDILLTGDTGLEFISCVYRNDAGTFTNIDAGLAGVTVGSAAWGDYDNDGDLDILLTGDSGSEIISIVYDNDAGVFTDIAAGLAGVAAGSVAWGDYDNDGDLDILLTGYTGAACISSVYENGAGTFTDIGAGLTGVDWSSAAWGDYDNDSDLDILLTGHPNSANISLLYKNNDAPANTPPDAPDGLSASIAGNQVILSWNASSDVETPSSGLTYNLWMGSTPSAPDIVSPMSDLTNGYRKVGRLGNTNHNISWIITLPDPPPAIAYWGVQAIDTAFEGSDFSPSESIILDASAVPEPEFVPMASALGDNHPNPFRSETMITFDLPLKAEVSLEVFDTQGRLVKQIENGFMEAGHHHRPWLGDNEEGRRVPAGVYFCRLRAGAFVESRKLILSQ